eukprot:gene35430-43685_t
MGTISIIIIIVAILCIQSVFHALHAFTHETSFRHMVTQIENELMIVGCSAFIFKVIVNTTSFLDSHWAHALEFAELLIPVMSFCYCLTGVLLIVMALNVCDLWSKAYHLKLIELIDDYLNKSKSLLFRLSWKPTNKIISEMEFRIFHHLFCEMFKIQRDAFAFDEYVHKVFENFVTEIIEIRPIDWFIVCVVVLINLARKKLDLNYSTCAEHDYECDERGTMVLFTIAGGVIFTITLIFVGVSRNLELQIMARRGVKSWHLYAAYLQNMEENADRATERRRLNVEELKMAVLIAKSKSSKLLSTEKYLSEKVQSAQKLLNKVNFIPSVFLRKKGAADSPEAVEAIMQLARDGQMKRDMVPQRGGTGGMVAASIMESGSFDASYSPSSPFTGRRTSIFGTGKAKTPMPTIMSVKEKPVQLAGTRAGRYATSQRELLVDVSALSPEEEDAETPPLLTPSGRPEVATSAFSNDVLQYDDGSVAPDTVVLQRIQSTRIRATPSESDHDAANLLTVDLTRSNRPVLPPISRRDSDGEEEKGDDCDDERGRRAGSCNDDVDSDLSEDGGAVAPAPLSTKDAEELLGFERDRIMSVDACTEETMSKTNSSKKVAFKPSPRKTSTNTANTAPTLVDPVQTTTANTATTTTTAGATTSTSFRDSFTSKKLYNKTRRRFPVYFVKGDKSGSQSPPSPDDEEDDRPHSPPSAKGKHVQSPSFLRKQFTKIGHGILKHRHTASMTSQSPELPVGSSVEQSGSDVMHVFWLSSPEIYFECVQLLIIIIALYMALWLTNFISVSSPSYWKVLSLLPGVLSMVGYVYVVRTAALLKAIYRVDFDVVLEVIEQTEGVAVLSAQLRDKVIARLNISGDPHAELQKLYKEIDGNGDDALSRKEFELFMNNMGINFSRRKWAQIYKEVDRNYDNCISFQEFYLFLYP